MSKSTTCDSSRSCTHCGSTHTYTGTTKIGKHYPHWYSNPCREDTWLCGKCFKNLGYHNRFPTKEELVELRNQRMSKRVCSDCNGTTMIQNVGKSSYHIWHRNTDIRGTWLCARCYATRYYAPKKKFKTKQQQYEYLSKLFSGKGNPMFGDHIINLGRNIHLKEIRKYQKEGRDGYPSTLTNTERKQC